MFERYTEDARRTLFFARYEATQLGGMTIEPGHLLLGLLHEGRASDLVPRGLDDARSAIAAGLQSGAHVATAVEIPFSAPAQRVLMLAAEEADALKQSYIGAEHLVLGILRQDDSTAARYLAAAGVRLQAVREKASQGRTGDPLADVTTADARPSGGDAGGRISFTSIGTVRGPYQDTASIPKGLGAAHAAEGVLEIRQDLAEGLADIEGFSHLYVIWCFHRVDRAELTAHPPSDDRPHGVFATRSPQRPNPIGLTVVELLRRDGTKLHVRGVDMLDGTPILDIKPYLSSIPPEHLRRGWLADAERRRRAP